MQEAFCSIGMTYTDEAKSVIVKEDRRITDCTFLKRGFLYAPDLR